MISLPLCPLLLLSLSPHLISTGSLSASSPPLFSSRSLAARRHCVECERETGKETRRNRETRDTQPAKGGREREKKVRGVGVVVCRAGGVRRLVALLCSLPFPSPTPALFLAHELDEPAAAFRSSERRVRRARLLFLHTRRGRLAENGRGCSVAV